MDVDHQKPNENIKTTGLQSKNILIINSSEIDSNEIIKKIKNVINSNDFGITLDTNKNKIIHLNDPTLTESLIKDQSFYPNLQKKILAADKRHMVLIKGLTYETANENEKNLLSSGFIEIISLKNKFNKEPKAVKLVCKNYEHKKDILNTKLFLNNQVYKISPTINIVQCHKCYKYGHNKFSCTTSHLCGKCNQSNHTSEKCTKYETFCVNCNLEDHESTDRRCPFYKNICRIEEEKERNLILSNSPKSYETLKRIQPETGTNKHSSDMNFSKVASFSNEYSQLKTQLNHVTSAINNINENISKNQENLLINMTNLIKSSFTQLKHEIHEEIEEKIYSKTAQNNTNLIKLFSKDHSENPDTQQAKLNSLLKNAKNMNIPINPNTSKLFEETASNFNTNSHFNYYK
jgi:hypothetical protein